MKIATIRRRLLSVYKSQQRLFQASVESMICEYEKISEAKNFLDSVKAVRDLLAQQTAGVDSVFAFASRMPSGEGNRSAELFEAGSGCGAGCHDYLTAKRKMVVTLGDLDEQSPALALISEITAQARPLQNSEPKKWKQAIEVSGLLGTTQRQIFSLHRQVEAITATQEAILRSFGLQFWHDRRRLLRYEGDAKGCA